MPFIIGGISEVVSPEATIARMASDAVKIVAASVMGTVVYMGFVVFQAHARA